MERLADLQWSYQSVCKRNEHTKIFFNGISWLLKACFWCRKRVPAGLAMLWVVYYCVFFCLFVFFLSPSSFTSSSTKIRPFLPHLLPFLPPFIHVFTTTVQTCRCGRFLLDLYKCAVSPLLFFFHFCFSASVSWSFFFLSLKLCFDEEEEKKDTKRKTTSVLSIRKRKTNMWNIPGNGDCLRSVSLDDPACIKEKRKKKF